MVKSLLQNFLKGDKCEEEIYKIILKHLRNFKDAYIIPKYYGPEGEIDLLIIDPLLGIVLLDVKNWSSFSSVEEIKRAFNALKRNNDFILNKIKEKFPKIPINTVFKIVFCSPPPKDILNNAFVQEHIKRGNIVIADKKGEFIKDLFISYYELKDNLVINKREIYNEILKILSIKELSATAKKKEVKDNSCGKIYITPHGIIYLDSKFSSVLASYNKGLRIIRGLAGTGKTVILTNLIFRKSDKNFLFLCFNRKLKESLEDIFKENTTKNVEILTILELLQTIDKNFPSKASLKEKISYIKRNISEIQDLLKDFLIKKDIDIIIIDEAQDFPSKLLQAIFEINPNLVIGIDEGQNIYDFGISNIKEVFKNISLRGKVTNLKTIYRIPENIAQTAIKILSLDETLHPYYRSEFLNYKNDLKYLLPGGKIYKIYRKQLTDLLEYLDKVKDYLILVPNRIFLEEILKKFSIPKNKIATIDSVKGLEEKNIIVLGFNEYLTQNLKYHPNKIFRRLYTFLTRAKSKIYIDLYKEAFFSYMEKNLNIPTDLKQKVKEAYEILEANAQVWDNQYINNTSNTEDLDELVSSIFTRKGKILKTTFFKLAPIIEFLANIKGLLS
jgi:hypothetical protein